MTRFLVLLIAVYVIYYLFKNSLRSKTKRNALQSNKGENTDVVNTHLKEIAYVFYSTAKDRDTCDTCLALDGKHLLPNHKILNDPMENIIIIISFISVIFEIFYCRRSKLWEKF